MVSLRNSTTMATACSTHTYDGQLREKWFQMRPMLIERYLPQCVSFDDTLKEIEQWLDRKYFNVKRIGRARRSLRILATHRKSNFDSRNDIDVEELLPILWDKVRNQNDIHDTFYEQLCDITGGSCAQGRSTRLFQFLFLFDLPTETPTTTSNTDEQVGHTDRPKEQVEHSEEPKEPEPVEKDASSSTIEGNLAPTLEEPKPSDEQVPEGEEQQTKEPEVNGIELEPSSIVTETKDE